MINTKKKNQNLGISYTQETTDRENLERNHEIKLLIHRRSKDKNYIRLLIRNHAKMTREE